MGLFTWAWVVAAYFGGVTLAVIFGIAALTYVRRTWQQIRLDDDGGAHQRLLDGLERVETRLEALTERLERIEHERIGPGEREPVPDVLSLDTLFSPTVFPSEPFPGTGLHPDGTGSSSRSRTPPRVRRAKRPLPSASSW